MFKLFQAKNKLRIEIDKSNIKAFIKGKQGKIIHEINIRGENIFIDDSIIKNLENLMISIKHSNYICGEASVFINIPKEYIFTTHINSKDNKEIKQLLDKHFYSQLDATKGELYVDYEKDEDNFIIGTAIPKKIVKRIITIFKNNKIKILNLSVLNLKDYKTK